MAFSGGQNSYGWPMDGEFRLLWRHFDQEKDEEPFHWRSSAHIVEALPEKVLGNITWSIEKGEQRHGGSRIWTSLPFLLIFQCHVLPLCWVSWGRLVVFVQLLILWCLRPALSPLLILYLFNVAPFTFSAMWPCQYTFYRNERWTSQKITKTKY